MRVGSVHVHISRHTTKLYKVLYCQILFVLLIAVGHGNTLMLQVIVYFVTLLHITNKPSTNARKQTVRAEGVCSTEPCGLYQEAYIQTGSKQHRASQYTVPA